MKIKASATVIVALIAGILAFAIHYSCFVGPVLGLVHHPNGEMKWLRQEFHLSDAQYNRVCELHCAYAPRCTEMCQRITDARTRLAGLIAANREPTAELQEALKATASMELECRQAMLAHIYAVAAAMNPDDGQRYLATMTPLIVPAPMPTKGMNCGGACKKETPTHDAP